MAHPADMAPKAPPAFAGGRLSPEEAERLASTFRPSWELDDAPFTGPGTLSEGDLRALQGGGTHADVRAVAQVNPNAHASNGSHAPPAPTQSHEPENSVIIDRSITADVPKPVAATKAGATMLGMAPPPAVQAAPQAVALPPPTIEPAVPPPGSRPPPAPISRRPPAPAFNVPPPAPARAKPISIDLEEGYPKKSKTGLWAAIGAGGVVVIGLVVWLVASSGGTPEKAATTAPTATKTVDDKLSAVPPPPTTAAAATPTADTPPPATTVAAAPPVPAPAPIPTTPVTALPQAAPTHVAAQTRPSYGGGAPAARPAPKPKGGQTIVRDVPF